MIHAKFSRTRAIEQRRCQVSGAFPDRWHRKPEARIEGLPVLFCKKVMIKFDLSTPQGGSFEVSASDLGLDQAKFSEIQTDLEIEQLDGAIHVTLKVRAKACLECDRTLQEFVAPVANVHEMLLYTYGQKPSEENMIEQVELEPKQRVFDLMETIRDTLMLAIPARKVAPEAEELQIQTVFGAPATEADQRWSALLAVREEYSHK